MFKKANAVLNMIAIGIFTLVALGEIGICLFQMIPAVSEQGMVGALIYELVPIVFTLLLSVICCVLSYFYGREKSPTLSKGILIPALFFAGSLINFLWNVLTSSFFTAAASASVYMVIARTRNYINMFSILSVCGKILMLTATAFLLVESIGDSPFADLYDRLSTSNIIFNLIAVVCSVLLFVTECIYGLCARSAAPFIIIAGFITLLLSILGYGASILFMRIKPKNIVPGVLLLSYLGPGMFLLETVSAYFINWWMARSQTMLLGNVYGYIFFIRNLMRVLLGCGDILAIIAAGFLLAASIKGKDTFEEELL